MRCSTASSIWRRLAPATEKPLGAWMEHFMRRHKQYAAWITGGQPKVMWLSGLHIPESYSSGIERPSGSGPGLCSLFNYYLHCDFEAYPPRTMMEWNKLKNLAWWFGINRTIH